MNRWIAGPIRVVNAKGNTMRENMKGQYDIENRQEEPAED